jgi:hypothetical protein
LSNVFKDQQNEAYRKQKTIHGSGGPLAVSNIPYRTPLSDAFLETGQAAGKDLLSMNYLFRLCMF